MYFFFEEGLFTCQADEAIEMIDSLLNGGAPFLVAHWLVTGTTLVRRLSLLEGILQWNSRPIHFTFAVLYLT